MTTQTKTRVKKTQSKSVKDKHTHIEIERKFILKNIPKKVIEKYKKGLEIVDITQYYFNINGVWNRYRVVNSKTKKTKTKYIHTIKSVVGLGANDEYEKAITEKEFFKKKKEHYKKYSVIKKTRYTIKFKGFKFEIDVYKDLALVVLEVELKKLSEHFEYPEGLFEEIIIEATGMKQFSNLSLATKISK